LKMNSLKYMFGMSVERFLGFIMHEKGIEVDQNKVESQEARGADLQTECAKAAHKGKLLATVHCKLGQEGGLDLTIGAAKTPE
jgi:hypothetical protein